MAAQLFFDRAVEITDLPLEFGTQRGRFVSQSFVQTLNSRINHPHLSAEKEVPNLIDALGCRIRGRSVSRLCFLCGDLRHDPLSVESAIGRKNVIVAAMLGYLM